MTFIETYEGVVSISHDLLIPVTTDKAFRHLDSSLHLLNIILCSLDGHALMDRFTPFLDFCFGILRGVLILKNHSLSVKSHLLEFT